MNASAIRQLSHDDFDPPFGDIAAHIIDGGTTLYGGLAKHMRGKWGQRPLTIQVVDNPQFNAVASRKAHGYVISVYRGLIEELYGTVYGLMSCPQFLPQVGDPSEEDLSPQNIGGPFPALPILRSTTSLPVHVPFPKDPDRVTYASLVASFALDFLVFHEIGHVIAGHLEMPSTLGGQSSICEYVEAKDRGPTKQLSHVIECDADAFACHALSWIHLSEEMAKTLHGIVDKSTWSADQFVLVTYLVAVAILFRCAFRYAPVKIDEAQPTHPHPAVRASVVSVRAGARSQRTFLFGASDIAEMFQESVGNVEQLWAELCLPGQNPQSQAVWARSVWVGMDRLLRKYTAAKQVLDCYSHIDRRWHDWEWPSSFDSS